MSPEPAHRRSRSIRLGLALALAGLFSLLAAVGVVAVRGVQQVEGQVEEIDGATAGVAHLAEAQAAMWQLRWRVAQYLADPASIEPTADELDAELFGQVRAGLDAFAAASPEPAALEQLAGVRRALAAYEEGRPGLVARVRAGDLPGAVGYRRAVTTPAGAELTDAVDRLVDGQRARTEARARAAHERADAAVVSVIGIVATTIGVGAVLAVAALRRIGRAERQLAHLAAHDPLTGLANRTALHQQLQRLCAAGRPASLLLIDLDGFKQVNDSLGHGVGDEVLVEVAGRLRAAAGGRLLVRLGGDEFALVEAGPVDPAELAASLAGALAPPILVAGVPLAVRASIGIARAPHDAADPGTLLQLADAAMYAAKGSGRTWARCAPEHRDPARRALLPAAEVPASVAG